MSPDVALQLLNQLIDTANDVLSRFLYIFMLLLMTCSLFLGNFFIDE